ncbi:MAG: Bax inhibitor-1/YccA family protein [Flavobacteriaceae bacterium]|nr:Bax inhibitor-1/YccA family protein [Flavobacteriaceae bacterium]
MSLLNQKTSNPAFNNGVWNNLSFSERKMTLNGIILKTFFCLTLVGATTWYVWGLVHQGVNVKWYTTLGLLVAIVLSILTSYKHKWAKFTAPLYSLAKGFFLGGFSAYAELRFEGMPMRAVGITIITFFVMLILYKFKVIRVTKQFRSVIISATITIMVVYIITWILSFFGISNTLIHGTSWFAIGFNIIAACVASLALLLDFDFIERKIDHAPKYMEWVATWGLLVTLIWLYVEVLRLMKKLAIRF